MAAWLIAAIAACGTGSHPVPPRLATTDRVAPQPSDRHPYCRDAEEPTPCPCDPGYSCVRTDERSWCLAVWEADCLPRCLPRAKPSVLCHGNDEVHGLWTGRPVDWMAVSGPSSCPIGGGRSWRVWGTKPDDRPRANGYLDEIVISTWKHPDATCTSTPPSPDSVLPHFFERNPDATVYLLMFPGYAGTLGEIFPNEP